MNIHLDEYTKKLKTAEAAVSVIRDGDTVIHGMTIAEPPALLGAIAHRARAGDLKNIKIYSFNPQKNFAETVGAVDLADVIETYTLFVSAANRNMVKVGLTQFIPVYLHQIPKLLKEQIRVDVTVTTVSRIDKDGFFSLGTCNDYTSVAARLSKHLIVEVNENMPRVFGQSMIHISEVESIVENTVPLTEINPPEARPLDPVIGKIVAEHVPDGATIQLGIGALPNALAPCLSGHKDLGIHTELLGPGMVNLIEKGVITGRRKNLHPARHVFALAYGNRHVYEFMNDNPSFESYPSSYVMDPAVIARNDSMISVNAILEIDLLGQCNAEFLDGAQYSGTGGQLDFVRGAYNSKGGKAILVFYSTAKDGEISRIVSRFPPGTMITTPRMDVHYLATEYGIVNLKGKSTRERALALISIAHPKFRDELMREAEDMMLM